MSKPSMHVRNVARLGRLRQRFEKFMTSELTEAGYNGLAPAHAGIAAVLYSKGPLSMSTLAYSVEKRKPTVTVLVNKLLKFDYVEASKDKNDHRVTLIALTEKGEEFARVASKISTRITKTASNGIAIDDLDLFEEVLGKLLRNLDEYH